MQKAQRGAYAPLWCSCFSELFLFFLAGGNAALKPIPGCLKQADCFGCAGRGLPILQKDQFAALAPCCSCYVWSRILFLLVSFRGFYFCCTNNIADPVPGFAHTL